MYREELKVRRSGTFFLAFLFGVMFVGALALTSGGMDMFESPLWWPGWIMLPIVAGLLCYSSPKVRGLEMALALVGPQAAWVIVKGAFLTSPEEGANLWPLGLMFVLALGGLVIVGAEIGRSRSRTSLK